MTLPPSPMPDPAWRVPAAPSRLLAWHRGAAPPDPRALASAGEACGVVAASLEPVEAMPPVAWALVARERDGTPWLFWCEPSECSGDPAAPPSAREARWIVGAESLLDPRAEGSDAASLLGRHRSMQQWLRAIGADAALLDPVTGRWLDGAEWRDELDRPASLESLWCVRAHRRAGGVRVWLATEGLSRCGRPELELLEIPEPLAPAGAAMLDGLAALLVEGPPAPETPWAVGPGLEVSLERLDEVLPTLEAAAPGSREDRRRLDPESAIDATRAVVCAGERRGAWRRIPIPPIEALERLARGEAALWRSRHEAQRLRAAAAAQGGLVERVARLVDSGHDALAASVAVGGEGGPPEWARVVGASAEGWLVQPLDLSGRPIASAPATIASADSLVDWRVELSGRTFGPDEAEALARALDGLVSGAAGAAP